jgi:hypothetical protein
LHFAARQKAVDVVKTLLADDRSDPKGYTMLKFAVHSLDALKVVVEDGRIGKDALCKSAVATASVDVARALYTDYGAIPDADALWCAIESDCSDMERMMLMDDRWDRTAYVADYARIKFTVLHLAVLSSNKNIFDVIIMLLLDGRLITSVDHEGRTAMQVALDALCNPFSPMYLPFTPLDAIRVMVNMGVCPNALSTLSECALGRSYEAPMEAVELLLDAGADPSESTRSCRSPLVIVTASRQQGSMTNIRVLNRLLNAGAVIDDRVQEDMRKLPWFNKIVTDHMRWKRRAWWVTSLVMKGAMTESALQNESCARSGRR